MLGEVASRRSLAAAPIAQRYKIPMITPSSTNERVTEVGDYIFRVCFIDPFQGEVLAKFAFNDLKARKVAILKDITAGLLGRPHRFDRRALHQRSAARCCRRSATPAADADFKAVLTQIRSRSRTPSSPPATTPKPPSSPARRASSA